MSRKPRLTIKEVCIAYAEGVIQGHISQRMIQLPFGQGTIERVLNEAVQAGYIGHSGQVYRGWLTSAGLALLDDELRQRYARAVTRRGSLLGAG